MKPPINSLRNGLPVWEPPRGISYEEKSVMRSPFILRWSFEGRRRSLSFATAKERERQLAGEREASGRQVFDFDPQQWNRWKWLCEQFGDEVDWTEVLEVWRLYGPEGSVDKVMVPDAVARYLTSREKEGIAHATLCHARKDLGRFEENFFDRTLSSLRPDDVRTWLVSLPFSELTKRNHYKRVSALFGWAKRERLARDNPCESIQSPRREADTVEVLTVEETEKLFATAAAAMPAVTARLALEAFAGLRFSSAARLVKEDVNFADLGITLPASKIKTRRRQYIDGLPPNLWQWLQWAPPEAWALSERNYLRFKSEVFLRANVPHPRNCLRHSFCSYHVAQYRDAARTAVILCHTSPRTLYQHYKGRAASPDASRYFAIAPPGGSPLVLGDGSV